MAKNEIAKATIYLDGKQAEAALEGLKKKSSDLREAFQKAKEAGDTVKMDKIQKELSGVESSIRSVKKETFDYEKVLKNMNGSSLNELKNAYKTLLIQVNRMKQSDPGYLDKRNQLKLLNSEIKKVSSSMYEGQGAWGKFMGMAKGFLPAIGIAAVTGAIGGMFSNIVRVREEFSRYSAVLKNTLGSQSEANKAMADLTQFAAKTPFQLNELTDSYVKLTNQGFQPTMSEMTKMGDLAASMGKPFDQLTEAVIDAQTGENERLKEFGIKAQKNGNIISYTFKGVTTEVSNNAESIRSYLLSLGEMEGVQGSMAAISKTIGGAISNTKDAMAGLWNSIGEKFEPVLVNVMGWFSGILDQITTWIKSSGNWFNNLYNWFADFYNNSLPVRAAVEGIELAFSTAFTIIKAQFQSLFNVLKTAGQVIKAIFTGNFDEIPAIIKASMDKQKDIIVDNARKIAEKSRKAMEETLNGKVQIKVTPVVVDDIGNNKKSTTQKPSLKPGAGNSSSTAEVSPAIAVMNDELKQKRDINIQLANEDEKLRLQNTQHTLDILRLSDERIKAMEDERQAKEEATRYIIENAASSGQAAVEEAKTAKDAAKGVLNSIRDQLKARLSEMLVTQVAKVLAKVPFPFNIAAAAAAAGAVTFLFNKIVPKFESGGYTADGPNYQPAGVVHAGEWVAPQRMVKSPQFSPIIQFLESNRKSGNFSRVNIASDQSQAIRRSFATGGFVPDIAATASGANQNEDMKRLIENNTALMQQNSDAIRRLMAWKPTVYTELIKRDLQTLENIERNSKM